MSQVSEIPLPMEWQRRLIEAIRRKDDQDEEGESMIETSSDDIDEMDEMSDLGFGDSQESIQRSQEDSDNGEVNDEGYRNPLRKAQRILWISLFRIPTPPHTDFTP